MASGEQGPSAAAPSIDSFLAARQLMIRHGQNAVPEDDSHFEFINTTGVPTKDASVQRLVRQHAMWNTARQTRKQNYHKKHKKLPLLQFALEVPKIAFEEPAQLLSASSNSICDKIPPAFTTSPCFSCEGQYSWSLLKAGELSDTSQIR